MAKDADIMGGGTSPQPEMPPVDPADLALVGQIEARQDQIFAAAYVDTDVRNKLMAFVREVLLRFGSG